MTAALASGAVPRRPLLVALLAAPSRAPAQDSWPGRPLRVVVPFAPGGSTDILARILCQGLAERLRQQVVVDNRPGGATNVAAEHVVRSAADGYTLLFGAAAMSVNPALLPFMPYDLLRDLEPISLVARTPLVLVVHPSVPARTVAELLALARTRPEGLTYGSGGNGTVPHLATELLRSLSGAKLTHLPYRGQAQAMPDLLAGRLPMMLESLPPLLPPIRAGQLRALAVAEPERLAVLPEVPTLAEVGFPGFAAAAWNGLWAPAGTSQAIIARINAEVVGVLAGADAARRFAELGAVPMAGPPAAMDAFIRAEMRRWAEVVRQSGARVD